MKIFEIAHFRVKTLLIRLLIIFGLILLGKLILWERNFYFPSSPPVTIVILRSMSWVSESEDALGFLEKSKRKRHKIWEFHGWKYIQNSSLLRVILEEYVLGSDGHIWEEGTQNSGFWGLFSDFGQTQMDNGDKKGGHSQQSGMPIKKCSNCIILDNLKTLIINTTTNSWMGIEVSLYIHGNAALYIAFKHRFGSVIVPVLSKNTRNMMASFCTAIPQIPHNGSVEMVMVLGTLYEQESAIVIDKLNLVVGEKTNVENYMRSVSWRNSKLPRRNLCEEY